MLFFFFFFFTLVTGPRRSFSLKLSDTRVFEPQIRARLGTTAHLCRVVVLVASSIRFAPHLNRCPSPRGGLVFKAHRLMYHTTLGSRVIKKKKISPRASEVGDAHPHRCPPEYTTPSPLCFRIQGYLAHKKTPIPLGTPWGHRHRLTVGSYGEAFSYQRGTHVHHTLNAVLQKTPHRHRCPPADMQCAVVPRRARI